MADQTEAECLLETGAMYGRRVLLRGASSDPVFAGFKKGAFSLYFGDAPIFHFDLEGRWQRVFRDGFHYLKGLDTSVQTIDRVREGGSLVLKRKTLSPAEVSDVDDWVRSTALGLIEVLDTDRFAMVAPPTPIVPMVSPEALRDFLVQIAGWDAAAWDAHRRVYQRTYGPLPFLPPDCPSPVVVQATVGHDGGISFGGAPAVEYSVKPPDEFEAHARAVAALLGRRIDQCKSIFLGGADVLRRPVADVVAYLDVLRRVFPTDPCVGPMPRLRLLPPHLVGVHAFLDRFDALPFDRDALRTYRAGGLVRVTVGVESGVPSVRSLYDKLWSDNDLRSIVSDFKGAGIGVGVIVLVGAGGEANADRHVDATSALINSLDLGPGDLVSLIDAAEFSGPDPSALSASARARQLDAFKDRLAPVRTERKAKVVPYSLEKQGIAGI